MDWMDRLKTRRGGGTKHSYIEVPNALKPHFCENYTNL